MITLSLTPAILTGKNWSKINKVTACLWCVGIDFMILCFTGLV